MREKVFLETVEINSLFVFVKYVLILEEQFDLLSAEWYPILHDHRLKEHLLGDVTKS